MRNSFCWVFLAAVGVAGFVRGGFAQVTTVYTYDVSNPISPQLQSTHTESGRVVSMTYDSGQHQVNQTSVDAAGKHHDVCI